MLESTNFGKPGVPRSGAVWLHAKYMVVDNSTVSVGSQNWDWRALEQFHEIGARIHNPRFAQTFAAVFNFDWQLASRPDLPKGQGSSREGAPPLRRRPGAARERRERAAGRLSRLQSPCHDPGPSCGGAGRPGAPDPQHPGRVAHPGDDLSAIRHYGPAGWWPEVDTAVRDAAARGVQVHILVVDWALREPMQSYLKRLAVLPNMTAKFSRLPPAPEGFIP